MRERSNREPNAAGVNEASLMLSAALFMLLLAFFIVLNAFSTENANRVQSAFRSVNAAFGFVGAGLTDAPVSGDDINTGDMQEETAMSLRSVLPDLGFQARKVAGGGSIMSVVIPRNNMQDRWPALRSRLAELMMDRNTGGRYALQILALDGAAQAADLASYAAQLEQEGVDATHLSIGFQDLGRPAIELRFIRAAGS